MDDNVDVDKVHVDINLNVENGDVDDVGPRWWRWTEMGRPTRFREEHRATEVKASTCYQRRSVIGTELPIKKSKSSVGEAHE